MWNIFNNFKIYFLNKVKHSHPMTLRSSTGSYDWLFSVQYLKLIKYFNIQNPCAEVQFSEASFTHEQSETK